MAGGYLCFVISILAIGVVTAVIGDIASLFGCTLGIKDSVTAIVFVALGTSIPGNTFDSGIMNYIIQYHFNFPHFQIRSPVK
jgi:solute carrier family 8 (sodium/calcium exchanger)